MENQPKNIGDFLENDSFRKWAIENSEEEGKQWAEFLKQNPAQKDTFNKAIILLRYLKDENIDAVPSKSIQRQWRQFRAVSFAKDEVQSPRMLRMNSTFWRIAASLLLIGGLVYWQNTQETEVVVGNGRFHQVSLPDGSLVHLNANATLRYSTFWWFRNERNVLLNGNAYFEVKKGKSTFVVHADNFEVKVLGTKFEVNTLPNRERVYLNEGSVSIWMPHKKQSLRLHPNQVFSLKNQTAITVQAIPDYHGHDWILGKLTFDNAPLKEIAEQMHDLYGVELLFPTITVQKKFTASLPYTTTVDPIVVAIAQSFDFKVRRLKNDTIEFYEK
jgi:transmembrane sensor